MSDNLNDKKYNAIDPDSIITLNINGKFYNDLRGTFLYYLAKDHTKTQMEDIMNHITKGEIVTEEEYPLYVLFNFMIYMEAAAKEQGYIVQTEVPDFSDEEFPENPHSETGPSE